MTRVDLTALTALPVDRDLTARTLSQQAATLVLDFVGTVLALLAAMLLISPCAAEASAPVVELEISSAVVASELRFGRAPFQEILLAGAGPDQPALGPVLSVLPAQRLRVSHQSAAFDAAQRSDAGSTLPAVSLLSKPSRAWWRQARAGPHPVAVLSHGYSANGYSYEVLALCLAAHGYLVVAPHHADGAWSRVAHDPLSNLLLAATPAARDQRVAELRQVLAELRNPDSQLARFDPDPQRIVLIGHSLGAATVLAVRGQRVFNEGQLSHDRMQSGDANEPGQRGAVDHDVRAVVALSVPGPGFLGLRETSWDELVGPILLITGTQDTTVGTHDWRQRLVPFERAPAGAVWSAVVTDMRHHELGDYIPLATAVQRDAQMRAISYSMIVSWLDAQLGRIPQPAWLHFGFQHRDVTIETRP